MANYHKISADWVFPIASDPVPYGVLVFDDSGKIIQITSRDDFEPSEIKMYKGFLCPGFVNSHCHLELSHMKGMIAERTGLIPFIKGILANREAAEELKQEAMQAADSAMFNLGISVVGDISNVDDSFKIKSVSSIFYHTYIEVFNLVPHFAADTINQGKDLFKQLASFGLKGSIAPHAPYTVSKELFYLIDQFNQKKGLPSTMHNQETVHENLFFQDGSGELAGFYRDWGFDISFFKPTGLKSLPSVLPFLHPDIQLLLVHNTMSREDDILFAQGQSKNIYWCFNPNANLYIENLLPDFNLFYSKRLNCTIGTDSLASNWQLSILEEMKIIEKTCPDIPLATILRWATLHGAEFLNCAGIYGSLEPGKKPGIVLVKNVDSVNLKLTAESVVQRII